jgi:hypothetical protein
MNAIIQYLTDNQIKQKRDRDATIGYMELCFKDLYTKLTSRKEDTTNINKVIFQNILRKGVGDLFQEINAVCKNGAYLQTPSYINPSKYYVPKEVVEEQRSSDIIQFDGNGNAIRFFMANDRPSSFRFIFMLINGEETQINQDAYGGFVGATKKIIVGLKNFMVPSTDTSVEALTVNESAATIRMDQEGERKLPAGGKRTRKKRKGQQGTKRYKIQFKNITKYRRRKMTR